MKTTRISECWKKEHCTRTFRLFSLVTRSLKLESSLNGIRSPKGTVETIKVLVPRSGYRYGEFTTPHIRIPCLKIQC